jgi:hypothetical protein
MALTALTKLRQRAGMGVGRLAFLGLGANPSFEADNHRGGQRDTDHPQPRCGIEWGGVEGTFINGMQLKAACVTIIAATPASSQRFGGTPSKDKERLTERQLKR